MAVNVVVKIKDNETLDEALRRFHKKIKQLRIRHDLQRHKFYLKPSVARRLRIIKRKSREKRQQQKMP